VKRKRFGNKRITAASLLDSPAAMRLNVRLRSHFAASFITPARQGNPALRDDLELDDARPLI
jgi:hypothetical protein